MANVHNLFCQPSSAVSYVGFGWVSTTFGVPVLLSSRLHISLRSGPVQTQAPLIGGSPDFHFPRTGPSSSPRS
ncbi:hypothetical protein LZ31DRAFT_554576 [Colletotrichum somersetense]|nr:hypothetical protein LZ31DRAFT_554576 [Colletotrichum somersetense]